MPSSSSIDVPADPWSLAGWWSLSHSIPLSTIGASFLTCLSTTPSLPAVRPQLDPPSDRASSHTITPLRLSECTLPTSHICDTSLCSLLSILNKHLPDTCFPQTKRKQVLPHPPSSKPCQASSSLPSCSRCTIQTVARPNRRNFQSCRQQEVPGTSIWLIFEVLASGLHRAPFSRQLQPGPINTSVIASWDSLSNLKRSCSPC